jgi:hypothetical protein
MQIRIVTHYDVHNHGAVLQLNALKEVLTAMGHETKALTFEKNYEFMPSYASNKYNIGIKSIPYYLGYIKDNGLERTLFNVKKRSILNKFKERQQLIGESYNEAKDIDALFIGSDEVFSIEAGKTGAFYGYESPTPNIFSYAASYGPTTLEFINEKNAVEYIKNGLNHFKMISVRDMNSHNIVMQLTGKDVPIVCDPVFLYGYDNERASFRNPEKDPYVLIYAYDNNMNDKEEVQNIVNFAKENSFKVISAGFYHSWCDKNINVSPIELLEYFNGARMVFTDTFHGAVMSILFNVQFIAMVRTNANKLRFLLEEYNLLDRMTENFANVKSLSSQTINYGAINTIIKKKRELGIAYIKECLNNCGAHHGE